MATAAMITAPTRNRMRPASAAFSSSRDVLFLALLSAHGLVRDGINDVTVLRALVEHSEVLTQDDKGCQLVVHPFPDQPSHHFTITPSSRDTPRVLINARRSQVRLVPIISKSCWTRFLAWS